MSGSSGQHHIYSYQPNQVYQGHLDYDYVEYSSSGDDEDGPDESQSRRQPEYQPMSVPPHLPHTSLQLAQHPSRYLTQSPCPPHPSYRAQYQDGSSHIPLNSYQSSQSSPDYYRWLPVGPYQAQYPMGLPQLPQPQYRTGPPPSPPPPPQYQIGRPSRAPYHNSASPYEAPFNNPPLPPWHR